MFQKPVRIAMWSCSRNLSTAMMRAWGSRGDTVVLDEPLYAPWLKLSGAQHPLRDKILAHHEPDWTRVVDALCGPQPAPVLYEKHISKHLRPELDRGWLATHRHAFLVRDPVPMLASFARKLEEVTVEETGLPQQAELWRWLKAEHGVEAPIVDSRDVQQNPQGTLRRLCAALDVPWDPAMLSWAPGLRPTDGIWAPHWYDGVVRSTGFAPHQPRDVVLTDALREVADACQPAWTFLHARRLLPGGGPR